MLAKFEKWFLEKKEISRLKTNAKVLDFLVVDNFDFPRKIVKLNFGQKFDFSNSVALLAKNERHYEGA